MREGEMQVNKVGRKKAPGGVVEHKKVYLGIHSLAGCEKILLAM
jgi:hypothetical protein